MIEKRFFCILPDEFVFSQLACLDGIVEAIKNGGLTEAQKIDLEAAEAELQGDEMDGPVMKRKVNCNPNITPNT